jgi:hypothetical protein
MIKPKSTTSYYTLLWLRKRAEQLKQELEAKKEKTPKSQ